MSSSPTHGHGLHVVIPTETARAPATHASTPRTPRQPTQESTSAAGPAEPDHAHKLGVMHDDSDPTKGHGLFAVNGQSAPTKPHGLHIIPNWLAHALESHTHPSKGHIFSSDPTKGHGALFRVPPREASSPTSPRPSARVARRSSLFSATEAPEQEDADEAAERELAQHLALPAATEQEEPTTAELDGAFEQHESRGHEARNNDHA